MEYDDVSELMIKREHNILIVGNSASHIDKFFKEYSIPSSKYYDFTQINSDSDVERNENAVSFIRDAMNSEELTGNDSNLLIVFYVQIMPDDFVMQLHRF